MNCLAAELTVSDFGASFFTGGCKIEVIWTFAQVALALDFLLQQRSHSALGSVVLWFYRFLDDFYLIIYLELIYELNWHVHLHNGSCAFASDSDTEWIVHNFHLIEPICLCTFRSIRSEEWNWNFISFGVGIIDLGEYTSHCATLSHYLLCDCLHNQKQDKCNCIDKVHSMCQKPQQDTVYAYVCVYYI